jgi:hypothetical protein
LDVVRCVMNLAKRPTDPRLEVSKILTVPMVIAAFFGTVDWACPNEKLGCSYRLVLGSGQLVV